MASDGFWSLLVASDCMQAYRGFMNTTHEATPDVIRARAKEELGIVIE